jgi:hypothetical protein
VSKARAAERLFDGLSLHFPEKQCYYKKERIKLLIEYPFARIKYLKDDMGV